MTKYEGTDGYLHSKSSQKSMSKALLVLDIYFFFSKGRNRNVVQLVKHWIRNRTWVCFGLIQVNLIFSHFQKTLSSLTIYIWRFSFGKKNVYINLTLVYVYPNLLHFKDRWSIQGKLENHETASWNLLIWNSTLIYHKGENNYVCGHFFYGKVLILSFRQSNQSI